ncbi:hypothetical protein ACPCSQ_16025 [Streptomyces griseoincarnatus]|uniref:hypothetical protein n=1 Tax=Streptomyces sp. SMS_SU21 TaxID=2069440 RepID=UPI000C881D93|nr:hypothetical protein [Streptomyces sp. SMS_SU21]MCA2199884.1 hypothetical protein [Streptomyces sp. SMS_SU21]NEA93630.1 hypothetical protein [Actinospica acidiphila]
MRIRQHLAIDGSFGRAAGGLLETVTHGVRPTCSQAAVTLLASWSVPELTDEMDEVVRRYRTDGEF